MQTTQTSVFVIDDDESVQRALARLLTMVDFHVSTFSSVDQFMDSQEWPPTACVIADIRIPGTDCMLLPQLLAAKGRHYPVILLTAQDTLENRATADRAGMAAFFRKPVDDQALVDSIVWAMRGTKSKQASSHLDNGG